MYNSVFAYLKVIVDTSDLPFAQNKDNKFSVSHLHILK